MKMHDHVTGAAAAPLAQCMSAKWERESEDCWRQCVKFGSMTVKATSRVTAELSVCCDAGADGALHTGLPEHTESIQHACHTAP